MKVFKMLALFAIVIGGWEMYQHNGVGTEQIQQILAQVGQICQSGATATTNWFNDLPTWGKYSTGGAVGVVGLWEVIALLIWMFELNTHAEREYRRKMDSGESAVKRWSFNDAFKHNTQNGFSVGDAILWLSTLPSIVILCLFMGLFRSTKAVFGFKIIKSN